MVTNRTTMRRGRQVQTSITNRRSSLPGRSSNVATLTDRVCLQPMVVDIIARQEVEEKFKRNFRVNGEMRDEILVYDLFCRNFGRKWHRNAGKMPSKFGFQGLGFKV